MTDIVEFEYPKVRALTRLDRKKLSALIKDFADRSGNSKITSMLPGAKPTKAEASEDAEAEDDNEKVYELIKSVMQGLLEWVEEDLNKWFMELIGETDQSKYDAMPFDIEVHIIDALISQGAFNNFFMRASALYKRIRGLAG